ncbi:Annexin A13 [Cichlidogyrus casuarinus]|uniref:Annexin n=1 Tax=Cichlidogyrus casuarinus TaxID=1844966 RepID=A0ABD2PZT7_9PLAT
MTTLLSELGPNGEVFKPSIRKSPGFNAEEDAKMIEKACAGAGTDEKAINAILGKRTWSERKEIAVQYKTMYGQDIEARLKGELSSDYRKLVLALLRGPTKHLAYCCYKAIKGAGTDEQTLIDILACSTNAEIEEIKEAYQETVARNLEKDVKNDCSGLFERILVSLLQANRDEPDPAMMQQVGTKGVQILFDQDKATEQAMELHKAGEKMWGTDESVFLQILLKQSVWQIAAIDLSYQEIAGHSITKAIEKELSGDTCKALVAIVSSCLDRPGSFAKMLHKSMAGLGTNDDKLIRVIASRADVSVHSQSILTELQIDLATIAEAYEGLYTKTLASDIKGDISGDYQHLLLTILGEI